MSGRWYVYVESDEHHVASFDSFDQAHDWGKLNAERKKWYGWQVWYWELGKAGRKVHEEGYQEAD